uniref:Uncharacterized protein n=1 Tax=Ascaris lumbricoides TaxID=6252 RepID=A0A0M3HXU1_ASCLU
MHSSKLCGFFDADESSNITWQCSPFRVTGLCDAPTTLRSDCAFLQTHTRKIVSLHLSAIVIVVVKWPSVNANWACTIPQSHIRARCRSQQCQP